ncbi:MAG: hypothetical protein OXU31_04570 [Gammaproteobacteria bacterium]|nr:hypothetical protein [Gammaproteobacteria bacterium]
MDVALGFAVRGDGQEEVIALMHLQPGGGGVAVAADAGYAEGDGAVGLRLGGRRRDEGERNDNGEEYAAN